MHNGGMEGERGRRRREGRERGKGERERGEGIRREGERERQSCAYMYIHVTCTQHTMGSTHTVGLVLIASIY